MLLRVPSPARPSLANAGAAVASRIPACGQFGVYSQYRTSPPTPMREATRLSLWPMGTFRRLGVILPNGWMIRVMGWRRSLHRSTFNLDGPAKKLDRDIERLEGNVSMYWGENKYIPMHM